MDLRSIEIFCAVYEEGSISRAAARMGLTQPSVSIALRKLEEDLGIELFERNATGVRPVSATHGLYERFQRVKSELEAARRTVSSGIDDVTGPLRVALPPLVTQNLLPLMLPAYLERYPGIDLTSREGQPQRLIELVLSGDVDCAVSTAPPVDTRLVSRRIASEPYLLVASRRNGTPEHDGPVDLMTVAPMKLAVSVQSFRMAVEKYVDLNSLPIRRIVNIESSHSIKALVRDTDWQAILSATALATDRADYHIRNIVNPPMVAEYFMIRPARAPLPLPGAAFIAALEEIFVTGGS